MTLRSLFPAFLLFTFLITGCGGGGGGGGTSSITYSGATTEAAVDETNARELSTTAVDGTTSGDSLALRAESGDGAGQPSRLRIAGLAKTLAQAALSAEPTGGGANVPAGASQSGSGTLNGGCGGSVSYSLTYDDVTGSFSGTFTFNNYDDCYGEVINGSTSLSGTLNLSTLELEDFTYSFNSLSVTSGAETETVSGTIVITMTGAFSYQVTFNIVYRDGAGDTYKLEDYVVSFDESSSPTVITVSGRVFHPDYGYVTVTTTTPVQIYTFNDYPHAGVIVLTGATGTGGLPTTATVTFTGTNSYTIDVDSDGDGAVDTNYDCTWSPAACTVL